MVQLGHVTLLSWTGIVGRLLFEVSERRAHPGDDACVMTHKSSLAFGHHRLVRNLMIPLDSVLGAWTLNGSKSFGVQHPFSIGIPHRNRLNYTSRGLS